MRNGVIHTLAALASSSTDSSHVLALYLKTTELASFRGTQFIIKTTVASYNYHYWKQADYGPALLSKKLTGNTIWKTKNSR